MWPSIPRMRRILAVRNREFVQESAAVKDDHYVETLAVLLTIFVLKPATQQTGFNHPLTVL